ncbi:MAG TPA: hypothetical protein VK152_08265 [Paludibacter sp.]|nr:hypothetical protein [Paludibacter sp.]
MKRFLPIFCFAFFCSVLHVGGQELLNNGGGFSLPSSNYLLAEAPVGAVPFLPGTRDSYLLAATLTSTITKSVDSLVNFSYTFGSGPSVRKSFVISGSNLTGSIVVTPPAGYEISALATSGYTSTSKTIGATHGTVNPITLYVRLKAGLPAGDYAGSITLASADAPTQEIALSGVVSINPVTITVSTTTLLDFGYIEEAGPSAEQSFKVSGVNLTSGITLTPSENYEISIVSGSFFSSAAKTLGQIEGVAPETTFYVRLKAGLTSGTYNGTITLSTAGSTKTITLAGSVVGIPDISLSATQLPAFSYYIGNGPSAVDSFEVSCSNLSSFIIIAPSDNYEISDSNNPFVPTGEILLVPLNGNIPSMPVYVRLKPDLPVDTYNGTVTVFSNENLSKSVDLTGDVLLAIATSVPVTGARPTTVYASGNRIVVREAARNEPVELYSVGGLLLGRVVTTGGEVSFPASKGAVYVVKTSGKCWKVVL